MKTVFAFALLTGWPVCFAQVAPAVPDQTANAASPPTISLPVPRAGDPFFAPVAASRAPQTFHQRLMDYAVVTFGPRALFTPLFGSAFSMLHPPNGYPREWRQGMGAFGRIYGSRIAAHTAQQTARFLTAALLHEDFRYRPSKSTNVLVRSLHAVAFTLVDKSDSGNDRIAFSNFAGAAADGLTPTLYLPAGYNTLSRAETRMAFALGGFAVKNLTREFAPDLLKATRNLHIPFPRVPIPAWWTDRRR